ncbi:MAG TPA: hypothetical protein VL119_03700 [Acidimicrobiia bacterium]|nr:hypothetical protein [Acidimicrobiia bacterium]
MPGIAEADVDPDNGITRVPSFVGVARTADRAPADAPDTFFDSFVRRGTEDDGRDGTEVVPSDAFVAFEDGVFVATCPPPLEHEAASATTITIPQEPRTGCVPALGTGEAYANNFRACTDRPKWSLHPGRISPSVWETTEIEHRRIGPMPADASRTREELIDEAARAFATHGIYGASLIDMTSRAGQRNRGALHYHFGSRTGLPCAVLDRRVDFLARR